MALNGFFFLSFFLNQDESDHDGINLLADMHAIAIAIAIAIGAGAGAGIGNGNYRIQ